MQGVVVHILWLGARLYDCTPDTRLRRVLCHSQGHVLIKGLFNPTVISEVLDDATAATAEFALDALQHKVRVILGKDDSTTLSLDECKALLSEVEKDEIPFMQLFNLWQKGKYGTRVRKIMLDPTLGMLVRNSLGT